MRGLEQKLKYFCELANSCDTVASNVKGEMMQMQKVLDFLGLPHVPKAQMNSEENTSSMT